MTKELIEKIEDAYRRVRKIGPDAIYETELREVLRAAADALAARQPSEDDREATEAEIDKAARVLHMAKCCSLSGDSSHDFPEASELFAAGVVLNAVPRAAVPDAATEQASADSEWRDGTIIAQLAKAEAERDAAEAAAKLSHGFLEIEKEEHDETRADRDAALAAIESVRAIHKVKHGERPRYAADDYHAELEPVAWEKYSMCEGCSATWPCPTIAALDGAPEPEWEEPK